MDNDQAQEVSKLVNKAKVYIVAEAMKVLTPTNLRTYCYVVVYELILLLRRIDGDRVLTQVINMAMAANPDESDSKDTAEDSKFRKMAERLKEKHEQK